MLVARTVKDSTSRLLNTFSVLQSWELSADQKAQLKQQAQQFESQLAGNSANLEALEGAGVSYAQLGDFKRAEGLLNKLTLAKPEDAEAWRLLVWHACDYMNQ